jgi:hypothetical protein
MNALLSSGSCWGHLCGRMERAHTNVPALTLVTIAIEQGQDKKAPPGGVRQPANLRQDLKILKFGFGG